MKKIKINQHLFGILNFILFIIFLGSFLTAISAMIFGEVATKTNGVIKYNIEDSLNILFFSITIAILFYYFNKLIIPNEKNKIIHFSKCPQCKENFTYSELKNGKCKYCEKVDTIDMDEYYEKFPEELKDIT